MQRIPEPKAQARILAESLGALGANIPHQKLLEVVARMHGYRNWNVMQADKPSALVSEPPVNENWVLHLVRAAEKVVDNSDNAGCDDSLTVTSADAVNDLSRLLTNRTMPLPEAPMVVGGFDVEDVLSVRPDLMLEEAKRVLAYCGKNFDSEYGLNWDRIGQNARDCVGPAYAAEGTLIRVGQPDCPVVVDLSSGAIYLGKPDDVFKEMVSSSAFTQDLAAQPSGTFIRFKETAVVVDVSLDYSVEGGESDALLDLCQSLREANCPLIKLPR